MEGHKIIYDGDSEEVDFEDVKDKDFELGKDQMKSMLLENVISSGLSKPGLL